jgi:hypothetical protein
VVLTMWVRRVYGGSVHDDVHGADEMIGVLRDAATITAVENMKARDVRK